MTTVRREAFIFPLNTVLFPGGVLPLKVFEQRYLEMTKTCLRDNAPFGVCLIREGHEVGAPAVPADVGCLATISDWDMPQIGLFQLVTRGTERFRIIRARVARNGLMSADIELFPAEPPGQIDPSCMDVLKLIIERAGPEHFPSPVKLDDAAWVAYRLAEILPIDMTARQQLLELRDAAERFARLRRVLTAQGLLGQI
ncbi:MAG: LON peptidase substrate-binding domain-containing protein [Betaproteobacteria bacterium]|nr:LON peptidase substrate-binding domain-containing protein [Betaproteobacteria bacterium]